MIKQRDEITESEAREKNYKEGRIPLIKCQTNRNEYMCVMSLFFL